jgi:tetratricopeptide (TPR) repeat protein
VLCAAILTIAGCASEDGLPETSAPEALNPVVLPDLAALSAPVRQQLRDRFAGLSRSLENPDTPRAELAAEYGGLGQLLLSAKLGNEAESCFLHAERLDPDDLRWPYLLGHVYLFMVDRTKAIAAFERALSLRPNDVPTLVQLGDARLDAGQVEAAESLFLKAVSLQSGSAVALFGAGRAAFARQSYRGAVDYFERALAADSQASAIHYPLAMSYRALGDREKASAHLARRGDTWPTQPDPLMQQAALLESATLYESRGVQALGANEWAAAVAAFRKALELNPNDAAIRHRLGTALYAGGDAAGAVREFEEVLRRNPNFAKAQASLGLILNLNGRYRDAIGRFSAAVRLDPNYPEARLGLAEALRVSGQPEAALPHYEQAVKLDPSIAESWIGGAMALLSLRRQAEAREWIARAKRVHPDQPGLAELEAMLPR